MELGRRLRGDRIRAATGSMLAQGDEAASIGTGPQDPLHPRDGITDYGVRSRR
jgi:hypothetical protein